MGAGFGQLDPGGGDPLLGILEKEFGSQRNALFSPGSLKEISILLNHLKHGWLFQHQNKDLNHHLQVAMFRGIM